ncbi:response regulator transcription factor [Chryseolinea sp. T2]|uniref:LytR/AlgR family response regulator transcription factor n=1 Tax=Chryseolinea sp. T2 TaxID=3129255 RepID=UPI0030769E3B
MKIRTLIVDDEPHAIEIIRKYAEQISTLEVVGTCHNAIEAFHIIQQEEVDLLFLDVKMPGLSGTDLARSLKHPPWIVFTTAFQEYAVEGFDLNAVDYLMKPVAFDRFLRAVDKVIALERSEQLPTQSLPAIQTGSESNSMSMDHFLYLRIERRLVKLNTKEIKWIESVRDYVKVVTDGKIHTTKQKISVTEELLPSGEFLRVHRSYIVPLNRIESYHPNYVVIEGNNIPIGRNYKSTVSKYLSPPGQPQ